MLKVPPFAVFPTFRLLEPKTFLKPCSPANLPQPIPAEILSFVPKDFEATKYAGNIPVPMKSLKPIATAGIDGFLYEINNEGRNSVPSVPLNFPPGIREYRLQ